jgi:site-specific recombinase XerC
MRPHHDCRSPTANRSPPRAHRRAGSIDAVADLLGHASVSSSQVYLHPHPGRLRAAVYRVPSTHEREEVWQ